MIYLAEAIKLKSILRTQLHDLENELTRVAFVSKTKAEPFPEQTRTMKDVEQDLAQVRFDSRKLDALIYRANIDYTIEFEGETLPIVEAIERATQLRAEANTCKELATSETEEPMYGYGTESAPIYRIALFDPETYRQKALLLEKKAHALSNKINAKNYQIELDFNGEAYFL